MCQFILVICDDNVLIDWAKIIFFHLHEHLVNFQKTATFHLCSCLIYIIASQRFFWSGLKPQVPPNSSMPIYKCYPQFTRQVGMGEYCLVNDAFLMEAMRKLDGNPKMCFSPESKLLVLKFGSFYIQFDRFSYLRIGGYEKVPLKLPKYPEDLLVFLEVCRQMAIVNIKYMNMGKQGYAFPLVTPFSCKNNQMANGVENILKEYNLQYLFVRTNFDSKGFVKRNLYASGSYQHQPSIEDFWEDCTDENEVLRRDHMRLTLE